MNRLSAIPRDIIAARDYEPYARQCLDDNAWTYLISGAGDEITLCDNEAAYQDIRLSGSILGDVRGGHTRLELLGHTYAHPVFLAPIAYHKLFHPDGEAATALGAGAMDAAMLVSTLASTRLEDIAATATGPLWFQLYPQPSRDTTLELIQRAEQSGYKALVVTVDAPMSGLRNHEQRAGFALPAGVAPVNLPLGGMALPALPPGLSIVFDAAMALAPTWTDIEWIVSQTRLPVVLKGVLTAADARRAIEAGCKGIVVSNHGGRVLDTLPATIEALPAIVTAVDGTVPILIDGGIRRGSDIFKAIALGATAVLIGRPYIHALAAAGPLGVAHLIRTLREELEICMGLSGCPTLKDIDSRSLF